MSKVTKTFICAALALCLIASIASCSNNDSEVKSESPADSPKVENPVVTPQSVSYQKAEGGDCVLTVDLKGATLTNIKLDNMVVSSMDYLFSSDSGKLTFFEIYMLDLEAGEHVFTLTTSAGAVNFTINIVAAFITVFPQESYSHSYKSGNDAVLDVVFGDVSIRSVRNTTQNSDVPSDMYSYSPDKFTISSEYLDQIYGSVTLKINMSNNDSHMLTVDSSVVFMANFDDIEAPITEWYVNIRTYEIIDAFDGKGFHVKGNGGSLLLMGSMWHIVQFEPGALYAAEFDVKNNWSDEGEPAGFVGFNDQTVTALMRLNYIEDTLTGDTAEMTYDAQKDVYHLKVIFKGQEGGYIEVYCGYDPSSLDVDNYDLIFDNMIVYKTLS